MRADLHNHLLIGFQPEWLRIQGYSDRNLAGVLLKNAIKRKIGLVAITSEEFNIAPGSDSDRFSRICKDAEKLHDGGRNYFAERIGKNLLRIDGMGYLPKTKISLYVVNGQTVIVEEEGKRYDHLVVGSNQVPNKLDFDSTIGYCDDNNLPNFLEHMALESHLGVGLPKAMQLLKKHGRKITGIEHNSQMTWPECFWFVPLIGAYNRGVNRQAKKLAEFITKPYIATSDAHIPPHTGISYIEFDAAALNVNSEEKFLTSLKRIARARLFEIHEGYAGKFSWLNWASQFYRGQRALGKKS